MSPRGLSLMKHHPPLVSICAQIWQPGNPVYTQCGYEYAAVAITHIFSFVWPDKWRECLSPLLHYRWGFLLPSLLLSAN